MVPGTVASSQIDISNIGDVAGTFSLATSNAADSTPSLLGQIDLRVDDCGVFAGAAPPSCLATTQVYSGKVSAMPSTALGSFAASGRHRYIFTVTLPASTNSTFQGKSASVQFNWNATT